LKTQVVVGPVALASNFSPFGTKHKNKKTKGPNPNVSPKTANESQKNRKNKEMETKNIYTILQWKRFSLSKSTIFLSNTLGLHT
jgi:hypothetical protein